MEAALRSAAAASHSIPADEEAVWRQESADPQTTSGHHFMSRIVSPGKSYATAAAANLILPQLTAIVR
jgi:hypothetical protein